jgi:hypothetical protein
LEQQPTAADLQRALWTTDQPFAERARVPDELPEEKSDGD